MMAETATIARKVMTKMTGTDNYCIFYATHTNQIITASITSAATAWTIHSKNNNMDL